MFKYHLVHGENNTKNHFYLNYTLFYCLVLDSNYDVVLIAQLLIILFLRSFLCCSYSTMYLKYTYAAHKVL